MRKLLLLFWLGIIFSGISYLFWHNEWKYSLPTPVPKKYKSVKTGDPILLKQAIITSGKPIFLHFFNPDCPCSRFNMTHFKSLVKQYGDQLKFAVVVMSKDKNDASKHIARKYDLDIPILFDKSIADACGVYSTPQAVIITDDQKLYYRGNYNKSRYCVDKKSNYAQMAIDSLLNQQYNPVFSVSALKSYGCELPNCNK